MADKKKVIKGISPKGIAVFPWLTKPDTKFNADGVYSTGLRVSKEDPKAVALIKMIEEKLEETVKETRANLEEELEKAKGEKKAKIRKQLDDMKVQKPYKPVFDDDGDETDEVEFRFKANAMVKDRKTDKKVARKISFFDAAKKTIHPDRLFGGSVLKIAFSVGTSYIAGTAAVSVTLYIDAVQVLKLVKGGASGDMFEDESDEYETIEDDADDAEDADGDDDASEDSEDF